VLAGVESFGLDPLSEERGSAGRQPVNIVFRPMLAEQGSLPRTVETIRAPDEAQNRLDVVTFLEQRYEPPLHARTTKA
jgi:hypothetical protein